MELEKELEVELEKEAPEYVMPSDDDAEVTCCGSFVLYMSVCVVVF